jgi:hypothetical protein
MRVWRTPGRRKAMCVAHVFQTAAEDATTVWRICSGVARPKNLASAIAGRGALHEAYLVFALLMYKQLHYTTGTLPGYPSELLSCTKVIRLTSSNFAKGMLFTLSFPHEKWPAGERDSFACFS